MSLHVGKQPDPEHAADRAAAVPGSTGGPGTVQGRFPSSPSSVRLARMLVREVLNRHGVDDEALVGIAELLTSELVTNAVRYGRPDPPGAPGTGPESVVAAGTAFSLRIAVGADEVSVSVSDASSTRPAVGPAREDGGRGLQIVDTLATAWGSDPTGAGKTVWFQLYRP